MQVAQIVPTSIYAPIYQLKEPLKNYLTRPSGIEFGLASASPPTFFEVPE